MRDLTGEELKSVYGAGNHCNYDYNSKRKNYETKQKAKYTTDGGKVSKETKPKYEHTKPAKKSY